MGHGAITRPKEEYFDSSKGALLQKIFLIAGIVGILGSVIFLAVGIASGIEDIQRQFAYSYLFAYMVCFTICSGMLFWTMLHHAVDAKWSVILRRILENFACLSAVLLLFFAPIVWFIYINPLFNGWSLLDWWMVKPGQDVLYDWKAGFLNPTFLTIRFIFYFLVFIGLSWWLRSISKNQDKIGDEQIRLGFIKKHSNIIMRKISYAGLVGFGLMITFIGIDLLMALNFHWFSTMWGVYIFAGSAQASMALLIITSNALRNAGFLREVMTVEHNHIMGKLLFAFTVFWAYISFSQYMLIYYANIPEETIFFTMRNTGSWKFMSYALVVLHFFLPFLMLLTQPGKWDQRRLLTVCTIILIMHCVDHYWIVMPQLQYSIDHYTSGIAFHPFDILNLVGIVGILGFFFIRSLSKGALFPHKDPRLFESVTLIN
ncbi:MAG: hypothetical protein AAF984_01445 [Verrucomicrobiota bacterium]